MAHSTGESEYIATASEARMEVWTRILTNLGLKKQSPTTVYENNTACAPISRGEGKIL